MSEGTPRPASSDDRTFALAADAAGKFTGPATVAAGNRGKAAEHNEPPEISNKRLQSLLGAPNAGFLGAFATRPRAQSFRLKRQGTLPSEARSRINDRHVARPECTPRPMK